MTTKRIRLKNRKPHFNTRPTDQVRVIRDARDARRDYLMDRQEAKRLYEQGKMAFDVTNNTYAEIC